MVGIVGCYMYGSNVCSGRARVAFELCTCSDGKITATVLPGETRAVWGPT
jgi:hypothetical protein